MVKWYKLMQDGILSWTNGIVSSILAPVEKEADILLDKVEARVAVLISMMTRVAVIGATYLIAAAFMAIAVVFLLVEYTQLSFGQSFLALAVAVALIAIIIQISTKQ